MRVLLTGGAGFIGRSVAQLLVAQGHDVTVLDVDSEPLALLPAGVRDELRFVEAATTDGRAVEEAMAGRDRVAHLAAGSSFLMYELSPVDEVAGATAGFHRVIDAAVRAGVPRIVHMSTSAVYEGNDVPYSEDMELRPPDLKSLAKKVNEDVAALYAARYGIETVALRPFSVYGPGETSKGPFANVVSLFAWAMAEGIRPQIWGDGRQARDFVYVDDVAQAVSLALAGDACGVFNVGTGLERSFAEVVELIGAALGRSLEPEHIPVPISLYASRLLASTARARDGLGFEATTTLADGIAEVLGHLSRLDPERREMLGRLQRQFARGPVEPEPFGSTWSPAGHAAAPRRTAPGGTPTTRLNARLKAASDR